MTKYSDKAEFLRDVRKKLGVDREHMTVLTGIDDPEGDQTIDKLENGRLEPTKVLLTTYKHLFTCCLSDLPDYVLGTQVKVGEKTDENETVFVHLKFPRFIGKFVRSEDDELSIEPMILLEPSSVSDDIMNAIEKILEDKKSHDNQ